MRYGNASKMAVILKLTMNTLMAAGTLVYLLVLRSVITSGALGSLTLRAVVTCILFIIGGLALLGIIYNLRKIIESLINVTPFVWGNVKSLRRIAVACFVVAVCYAVNFFVNGQYKDFQFVSIDSKGVHTDIEFLIFFFAGCFIYILAEVFKQAVENKEENDFTI